MRDNYWGKYLAGLAFFCFVFGLGAYQAEARILENIKSGTYSRHAKETMARKINTAKMAAFSPSSVKINPSLGGTGSISGVVREYAEDEFGDPVEGPPLGGIHIILNQGVDPNEAGDDAWDWVDDTYTNPDGSYQFTGLTERRYRLNIDDGEQSGDNHYLGADQYQVQVFEGANTPNIDFTLRRAGGIWGYVKKASDNSPIINARVLVRMPYTEHGDNWHDFWVDETGRYELWLLPSPGEFYPISVTTAIDLGTTYKVYGGNNYICGEDGLHPDQHGYTFLGEATDTQIFTGAYSYYVILAEQGYLAKVDAVRALGGPYLWLECTWNTNYGWNIDDSGPDGQPALVNNYATGNAGGYLVVRPGPGSTGIRVFIVADSRPADPVYYEAQNAPGLYQAPSDAPASALAGSANQIAPASVHGPDFLLNEGGKIHGRVVNENGAPLENVEIDPDIWINGNIDDPDARTDADGYYTLISVPVTSQAYAYIDDDEVMSNGVKYGTSCERVVGPFNITAGGTAEAPDMVIKVAGMITGQVTDENGVPVVGAEIEVEGHDEDGYESDRDDVYTDAFGQYTLDYLAPGTYVVRAMKEGFSDGIKADVVVISGGQVDCDPVMQSAQAAIISGSITNYADVAGQDSNGVLLPNYDDTDYDDFGYPWIEIIAFRADVDYTDADYLDIDKYILGWGEPDDGYDDYFEPSATETPGNYEMKLPAGEYNIALLIDNETDDGIWYAQLLDWHSLAVTEGAIFSHQDFTAPAGSYGTLKGDINVPSTGENIWIMAFNENDVHPGLFDAISGPRYESRYNFAELPAGTYTIRAIARGFATQVYEHINVPVGGTTTRNIVFTAGGTLSGTITAVGGAPIEGAKVKVVETGSFDMTDAGGNYAITGLNPGNYTVEVSASGYATDTQIAAIADGSTTTHNVILNSQVGSIAGAVYENDGVTSVNNATVVAYNTLGSANGFYRTATTVGGAYSISELIYGDYIVAVNADGYDTAIYTATLTINGITPNHTNINFNLSGCPPEFSVSSSVNGTTLSMTFFVDEALDASPAISVITGSGALGTVTEISPTQWEVDYTTDAGDTVVEIEISGTRNAQPGSATFSFEVSTNLQQTATTNVTNAAGGETSMMGTQDDTSVYVPPFALAGVGDTTAVALTIERYGDPGDSVDGTDDQSVSAVYDFDFDDGNVTIAENHTITITMSFELPAGMTQQEFEDTFEVRYFNVNSQQWVTDGISNVRINWNNYTIMFEVDHLSEFAAFMPGCLHDGDVNLDANVTPADALLAFQHYLGMADPPLNECQQAQADANNDGSVTPADALCIFQKYLGLLSCLD